jgi:hypothetical protein
MKWIIIKIFKNDVDKFTSFYAATEEKHDHNDKKFNL